MSELATFRDWAEYNIRAREGYLAAFEKLPKEELTRDRGASYPTLLDIHCHILGGHWVWLKSAYLPPGPPTPSDVGDPPSLDEVRRLERQIDAVVREFFRRLTEADLDRTFPVPKAARYSRQIEVTVRDTLLHLIEEEIQHRGELNALLWQLDVEPPVVNWIGWKYIERPQPRS